MAMVVGMTETMVVAIVRRWTLARSWVWAEVSAVIAPRYRWT